MEVDHSRIEEFKGIVKDEYGIILSDSEAHEAIARVVRLFLHLSRVIPTLQTQPLDSQAPDPKLEAIRTDENVEAR